MCPPGLQQEGGEGQSRTCGHTTCTSASQHTPRAQFTCFCITSYPSSFPSPLFSFPVLTHDVLKSAVSSAERTALPELIRIVEEDGSHLAGQELQRGRRGGREGGGGGGGGGGGEEGEECRTNSPPSPPLFFPYPPPSLQSRKASITSRLMPFMKSSVQEHTHS